MAFGTFVSSQRARARAVDNYLTALRMVEQGAGVGLILLPIAQAWLDSKRLVLLDAPLIELDEHYWLVYPRHSPHRVCLQLFAEWLKSELSDNQDVPEKQGEDSRP
ncbi:MAG: hypothetical protein IH908_15860 [Proteobacteria bacterium]|nr:hypothetical protein [Pseudomonadota bacterium]